MFDKTEPSNTIKLRNLGIGIRPNWEAIESADSTFVPHALNLTDRTAAGLANDPTALADAIIMYSKQDGSANPQLFSIDPSSIITQLTGLSYVATQNGYVTLAGGIIIKWGTGTGINAGVTNTFPVAFPNNCWSVQMVTMGTKAGSGVGTITKTNFVAFTDGSVTVRYIAIGN